MLNGGTGADTMTGNAGAELFVFHVKQGVKANKDAINDVEKRLAHIAFDTPVFSGLSPHRDLADQLELGLAISG